MSRIVAGSYLPGVGFPCSMQPSCNFYLFLVCDFFFGGGVVFVFACFHFGLYCLAEGQETMLVSVLSINKKESLKASLYPYKKKSTQKMVSENLFRRKESGKSKYSSLCSHQESGD